MTCYEYIGTIIDLSRRVEYIVFGAIVRAKAKRGQAEGREREKKFMIGDYKCSVQV